MRWSRNITELEYIILVSTFIIANSKHKGPNLTPSVRHNRQETLNSHKILYCPLSFPAISGE